MKAISPECQELLIKSMQSTLSKLENACKKMNENGSNTTLARQRRDAVKIALECLENAWHGTAFSYRAEEILEARNVLASILPSVEKQYDKVKAGSSPQKTLLERRITSIEAAIDALETYTE